MKGEFYILQQPKKLVLSIVLVDSELPLSEEVHQRLIDLSETCDILFIFPEYTKRKISAENFGSLYSACGYLEVSGERGSEVLMRAFEYEKEIFEGKHSLILYTQTSDFTELGREKILEITASGIVKPIFKTRRLNSAEFFDIYKNNPGKENWLDRFFLIPLKETTGTDNIYSSCTTESKEILVRPLVVDKFLEFWRKEGTGYVYSFSNPDLRVFLASMCSKLGIEVLSVDAREI